MRIFLDANILVSVLNKEYPLYTFTSRIVSLADNKNFNVFTSPVSLAIAFYFAEKKSGAKLAKKKIALLASVLSVSQTGEKEVLQSLENNKVLDFEDGIEYYSAVNSKCSVLITEDIDDFYFAEIEVIKSIDFLNKYLL
jgi:predicted nucleic acid-binding protein